MSTAVKLDVPTQGQKITISNGKLVVPDQPIIPFIEGDGTGPDIWRASQMVFDAAVGDQPGSLHNVQVKTAKRQMKNTNIVRKPAT